MIFPLWRYWRNPRRFFAAAVWNTCEMFGIRTPFAHILFGWIVGVRGVPDDEV